METPWNRWRHDLREAARTLQELQKYLEGAARDAEFERMLVKAAQRSAEKLERQYEEMAAIPRRSP